MTVHPQQRAQAGSVSPGHYTVIGLLNELHALRAENRQLRRRVAVLETGRAKWRTEARDWKWHALGWRRTRYV